MSALLIALVAAGALDAVPPAPPDCAGRYEVVRTDTVLPGKLDVFLKAVRDQQAWYAAHGYGDTVQVGRVPAPDRPGEFSLTTAMTIHTGLTGAGGPPPRDDPAWRAVVAEYDASSVQLSTTLVCVAPP